MEEFEMLGLEMLWGGIVVKILGLWQNPYKLKASVASVATIREMVHLMVYMQLLALELANVNTLIHAMYI